jgi:serine/threonine-protein kinase PpkA
MMVGTKNWVLTVFLLAALVIPFSAQAESEAKRTPLKIEGKESLPLRVLARAFSRMYKTPDVNGGTVEENIAAFQTYYVYARKDVGGDLDSRTWYEVGSDNRGTVLGWMSSDDVFEWKQTMCLSYTHPEGRYPVLMFDKKAELERLSGLAREKRNEAVEKYYIDIAMGSVAPDFPIVTIEPKKAIDITKEFYLLPILEFGEIELGNREARILRLAAVTGEGAGARESSDIRKNKDYLRDAVEESTTINAATLEKLGIDIVWVMDTTNSMMPYITQTLKVVEEASKRISANSDLAKTVKFGVWGYRDSMTIADIGYNVKNYTPQLQGIDQFVTTLQGVDVTPTGSQGYAEDMFSGVHGAVDETAWTPDAIKVVVLVGDAPAHEPGHKWNASGQSQSTLRSIADDRNITIHAIHIKDPQAEKYHATAMEQFQTLSTNRGVEGGPAYHSTASTDLPGFEAVTRSVTDSIIGFLEKIDQEKKKAGGTAAATGGTGTTVSDFAVTQPGVQTDKAPAGSAPPPTAAEAGAPAANKAVNLDLFEEPPTGTAKGEQGQPSAQALADAALKAAFVQWIGSQAGAHAPRDVVAWVTDKDLLSNDIQSLEVRLLINKRQLDSLRETSENDPCRRPQGTDQRRGFFHLSAGGRRHHGPRSGYDQAG